MAGFWDVGRILLLGLMLFSCQWVRHVTDRALRPDVENAYLLIRSPGGLPQAMQAVWACDCLERPEEFIRLMDWNSEIRPGRYRIDGDMTHLDVLLLIRSGKQEPVVLRFNRMASVAELAGLIGKTLEGDSSDYAEAMLDTALLREQGIQIRLEEAAVVYIPNSYELYWNTGERAFVERMVKEYKAYWNPERKQKARVLGLSESEVVTLASVVQGEQARLAEEWGTIGRLYLNRLKKGMLLQADPTVKFAVGEPSLRRIRFHHLKVDHPYNTYRNKGLPPGPISLVDPAVVDSVLNAPEHSYIYMCAKSDFSGRHSFSVGYEEHVRNAEAFRRALDERERSAGQR
jgi:UPF0755 protein